MTEETKKTNIVNKLIGYFATGVTCVVVSVGVMLGADVNKVQDTLTKSQAKQLAMLAANYGVEQVLNKVDVKKEVKEIIVDEVKQTLENVIPTFVENLNETYQVKDADIKKEDKVEVKKEMKKKVRKTKDVSNKK